MEVKVLGFGQLTLRSVIHTRIQYEAQARHHRLPASHYSHLIPHYPLPLFSRMKFWNNLYHDPGTLVHTPPLSCKVVFFSGT